MSSICYNRRVEATARRYTLFFVLMFAQAALLLVAMLTVGRWQHVVGVWILTPFPYLLFAEIDFFVARVSGKKGFDIAGWATILISIALTVLNWRNLHH